LGLESVQNKIISPPAKNALLLGSMCAIAYLAVYVAKNALSAAGPQITQMGAFTTEQLGAMSSAYFIAYAVGQLINGAIGDRIKGKYMISFGLILAAFGIWALPRLTGNPWAATAAYSTSGFCLAMIYGPMTKLVAENTDPHYTPRCSMGYTLASFLGSPVAGLLAAALSWQWAFHISGGVLVVMGAVCFAVFTLFERKGVIRYGQYQAKEKSTAVGGVKLLIKRQIVRFTFVSVITGVVRTSVVFWLPTYLSSHLDFTPDTAVLIFTVATLVISCSVFVAIFAYERLKHNMERVLQLAFGSAAICFLAVFFVRQPVANMALLVLGILTNNTAASLMWSCYCPSLRDTGMVSGATGFLDFCSYMAASVSSTAFANSLGAVGWSGLILVWFGLMACGILASLPWERILHHESEETI
jgi:ACS family hexuronate transporter-like MFS transporter